jgi:ribosomal protein S17E
MIINNIQKNTNNGFESIYDEHKELTNTEFEEITADFRTNKIERIFVGTRNEKHNDDFENNRKIVK